MFSRPAECKSAKVLKAYNCYLSIYRVSGYMMSDKLEIPRMKVKKDWHVGLHPDPVDRSHPDVHDDQLIQEALDAMARKLLCL